MGESRRNFMMKPGVLEVILGSFVFLTVPLLIIFFAPWPHGNPFDLFVNYYFVCFGATHFFVTFSIYCNSGNLRYFASDTKNIYLYFALPIAIMAFIFCFYFVYFVKQNDTSFFMLRDGWAESILILTPFVVLIVGAVDILHVQRQSYGVLQLLKGSTGLKFTDISKSLEKLFFPLMALAAWITFVKTLKAGDAQHWGSIKSSPFLDYVTAPWLTWMILGFAAGIFLIALTKLLAASQSEGSFRQKYSPPCYFFLQSVAVLLAVIDYRLYAVGAAMHYVEYHFLVYQRSFKAEGSAFEDAGSPRYRRIIVKTSFYLVLIAITALFTFYPQTLARNWVLTPVFISVFMAVQVFHYYIDTLLWRFRKPFYRQTLGPVYFGGR